MSAALLSRPTRAPAPQLRGARGASFAAARRTAAPRAPLRVAAAVKVGDVAPDFTLKDQSGKAVKLSSFRAQSLGPVTVNAGRPVVLFFYPADATPGCTKEACAFRDAYADFLAAGAAVFGISADDAASHAAFRAAHSLPFPLLVDENDAVREAYGVPKDFFGALKGRQTYVVGTDGVVAFAFNNQFDAEGHVTRALKALQA